MQTEVRYTEIQIVKWAGESWPPIQFSIQCRRLGQSGRSSVLGAENHRFKSCISDIEY